MKPSEIRYPLARIAKRWVAHGNSSAAAAMAYYALFALAPTLVFATGIAGRITRRLKATPLSKEQLEQTFGEQGSLLVDVLLQNADFSKSGVPATLISAVALLYASSAVFLQLRNSLDLIFAHRMTSKRPAILNYVIGRLTAALLVVVVGSMLIASLVGTVLIQSLDERIAAWTGIDVQQLHLIGVLFSYSIVFVAMTAIFQLLPSTRPQFRQIWLGVVTASILFTIGKWLFGIYISHSAIATAYGPSSSLVAFIVWIYYSAQIILLGAELCSRDVLQMDQSSSA